MGKIFKMLISKNTYAYTGMENSLRGEEIALQKNILENTYK